MRPGACPPGSPATTLSGGSRRARSPCGASARCRCSRWRPERIAPRRKLPGVPERDRLCLLQVHAHPDDEASKGAGTTAKYSAEGVRTVLVCCTGGEAGDILNPAVDTPETRANLHAVRTAELKASVDALGYSALHMLGYHASGMPDTAT